jgi:hypothetical protein
MLSEFDPPVLSEIHDSLAEYISKNGKPPKSLVCSPEISDTLHNCPTGTRPNLLGLALVVLRLDNFSWKLAD